MQPQFTRLEYLLTSIKDCLESPDQWDQYQCLIWPYSIAAEGYGRLWVDTNTVPAHRYVFSLKNGPIEKDADVFTICGNRACFRPSHLRKIVSRLDYIIEVTLRLEDDPNEDWHKYPCIEWPFILNENRYGTIAINRKWKRVTRVAYESKWGVPLGDLHLLHKCDNPPCFRWSHLRPGTPKENVDDMWAKGRGNPPRGERNWNARLNWEQVCEIRRLRSEENLSYGEIGKRFHVAEPTVGCIITGRSWKHPR